MAPLLPRSSDSSQFLSIELNLRAWWEVVAAPLVLEKLALSGRRGLAMT